MRQELLGRPAFQNAEVCGVLYCFIVLLLSLLYIFCCYYYLLFFGGFIMTMMLHLFMFVVSGWVCCVFLGVLFFSLYFGCCPFLVSHCCLFSVGF